VLAGPVLAGAVLAGAVLAGAVLAGAVLAGMIRRAKAAVSLLSKDGPGLGPGYDVEGDIARTPEIVAIDARATSVVVQS
jgi:hypothetical protein